MRRGHVPGPRTEEKQQVLAPPRARLPRDPAGLVVPADVPARSNVLLTSILSVACCFVTALAMQLHVRVVFSRGSRCISHHGIGGRTCRVVHGRARVTMRLEPPRNAYREAMCSATLVQRTCDVACGLNQQRCVVHVVRAAF